MAPSIFANLPLSIPAWAGACLREDKRCQCGVPPEGKMPERFGKTVRSFY
jgi:hypothetical protein